MLRVGIGAMVKLPLTVLVALLSEVSIQSFYFSLCTLEFISPAFRTLAIVQTITFAEECHVLHLGKEKL